MDKKTKGRLSLRLGLPFVFGVVICFDQHTRGEHDSWEKTQVKKF